MKIAFNRNLEFLFSPTRQRYYVIDLSGSPTEEVTRANFPAERIINPKLLAEKSPEENLELVFRGNERDLLQQTDLRRLLRENQIEAFIPNTYSTPYLEGWAKRNHIRLACTPFRFQSKFENKIFFERFLRKHELPVPRSWILESIYDTYHVNTFPVVLQLPDSLGSEGTFVINSWDELMCFTSAGRKANFPFLCREFVKDAIPIGVSVLIGPEKLAFSAIRAQAFFPLPNGRSAYYGIQWLKTSSLNPKAVNRLNESLLKAGRAMQKSEFRGIVAFDLMIQDDSIFFIECNPRTGASSPQIAYRSELIHGLNFTEEYMSIMSGGELSAHKPYIPDSRYEGFTLDTGYLADLLPSGLPLNAMRCGVYSYTSGRLDYLSATIDEFRNDSRVFVYHALPKRATLAPQLFIGFIFTHFPLLELGGNQYKFSEEAKKLLKHLEDILVRK